MKIKNLFPLFVILTFTFLYSPDGVSQTLMQGEPSPQMEEAAKQQTEYWEDELSLTAKQMSLMEKKFVEFAIKRERILQSKMREEVKTRHLFQLEELENREMRDILTKPQYDRYIRLKKIRSKQDKKENPAKARQ